jgi:phage terminase small subunit
MKPGTKGRPDLRLINGTERLDYTAGAVTVEPVDPSTVQRPAFVKGKAKAVWDKYAPDRIDAGYLRPEDSHTFGQLCVRLADYEKDPSEFKAADLSELRKRLEIFGMAGPQSRARFKADGKSKSADPAERYFAS